MSNKPVTYNCGAGVFRQLYDLHNKEQAHANYVLYMLDRLQSMFRYEGLPESIPERDLILTLQVNGFACIPNPEYTNDKAYALYGTLGGEPNPYYMPTKCIVANPALKFDKEMTIDDDCIIIPHDPMYLGLIPLLSRYATGLVENDISILMAQYNVRAMNIMTAPDDATYKSAVKYLEDLQAGKLGAIAENYFLDGIKVHTSANQGASPHITELIELEQYFKAGWYNDLGLNANYNMKRESINSNEAQLNDDALLPLVDSFQRTQQKAFDKLQKWGYNIKVVKNSAWADVQEESEVNDVENQ